MAKALIIPYIETNHESIECNFYATMGVNAYAAALGSAFTGQFYATGGLALIGGAAELAYNLAGCNGDPPPPPPSGTDDRFCYESTTCELIVYYDPPNYGMTVFGATKALKIVGVDKTLISDIAATFVVRYIDCNGQQNSLNVAAGPKDREFGLNTTNCTGGKPSDPIIHEPGDPIAPPQTHTDENGCNWTIQATNAYVDNSGAWHTYYTITADNPACGGPFGYWSSKDGPKWVQPDPVSPNPLPPPGANICPDPCPPVPDHSGQLNQIQNDLNQIKNDLQNGTNCPDPCKDHTSQLNDIESTVDKILNKVGPDEGDDLFEKVLRMLQILGFVSDFLGIGEEGEELLPGVKYTLQGVCEPVGEGESQPIKERQIVVTKGLYAVIARVDALMLFMQDHLAYRTPTCAPQRPQLEGRWVTAQWISDEESPNSNLRLRKLLRWRTKSSRTDSQLADFFKDFRWEAGPVCVIHKGAWWGTPQVWAASIDEGRRVIREIAREAGIDPDLEGEWASTTSRNPRFGMTGTMRLRRLEGIPWVSSRDDSNMLPMG